jgi:MFS family permease
MGAILQCYFADWVGRKKALAIAAVFALVGGALAAGSTAIAMLIVVRLLQGCGLGMLLCLVPMYLTEVAPPYRRGLLTGLTTLSFGMGYVV